MLNYETLLNFVHFLIILGGKICSFYRKSTLNRCIRSTLSYNLFKEIKGWSKENNSLLLLLLLFYNDAHIET